jgi:type I restriction enzyme S subunit
MKTAWPKTRLGNVVSDLTNSRTFQVANEDEILDPTITSATHSISVACKSKGFEVRVRKRVRIEKGDLVFSRLHTQNGAFAFANQEFQATGTFIPLAVCEAKADSRFLFWALHQFVPTLLSSDTVGRETFKTEDILALEIPLPPLAEQRGIVARIEELAAQIQEARRLRCQTAEEADAFRASWFDRTFAGLAKKFARRLGDVTEIIGGGSLPDTTSVVETSSHVLLVKVSDMNRAGNEVFMEESALGLPKDSPLLRGFRVLPPHSIVFPKRGGAIATNKKRILMKPAVLDPNMMGVFTKQEAELCHEFLFKWFNNLDLASLQKGTSVPQINKGDLAPLEIPVPPLPEQRRIVAELDALQAEVDRLKALQAETATELDSLMPSILDAAFAGRLVAGETVTVSAAATEVERAPAPSRKATPFKDDAAIVCLLINALMRHNRPTSEFCLQKHIFVLKERIGLRINSGFGRKAAGPWSQDLKRKAIFAAERKNWLRWDGNRLVLGRSVQKGIDHAKAVLGDKAGEVEAVVHDLARFGNTGLERWTTILKVVRDLESEGKPLICAAIQHEIDTWPDKRTKEAFSEESVDQTVRKMVRRGWIRVAIPGIHP